MSRINASEVTLGTTVGNEPEDLGQGTAILLGTDVEGIPTTMSADSLVIGQRGSGSVDIRDGGLLNSGSVSIASTPAAEGSLSMFSTPSSAVSVANVSNLSVGGDMNQRGGRATMDIRQRSQANVGTLRVWPESIVAVEGWQVGRRQD